MSQDHAGTAAARPGRPRDEAAERALLEATVELLLQHEDPARVTIAAIVGRAGVARATLYRRWSSREELIAAALDTVRRVPEQPDTGSLRGDLTAIMQGSGADPFAPHGGDPRFRRLVRTRVVQAVTDPRLRRVYWENHVRPRRGPMEEALRRAAARGEVAADLDAEAVVDLLAGAGYYQFVVRPDDGRADERMRRAVATLLDAVIRPREGSDGPRHE